MKQPRLTDAVLILVADQRQARLAACQRLRNGRVHVETRARLAETWNESAHNNPPSRSDSAGHQFDNSGRIGEERLARFAREILDWLAREPAAAGGERIEVFANPRLLGALRRVVPAERGKAWAEHALDLAGLSEGELAARAEIAALVPELPV